MELDAILCCLRMIIRKVVKEKLTVEDMRKLLPLDLAVDSWNTLLMLLQKYKNLWEEEATDDQPLSQQMRCKFPGRVNVPPACAPLADADLLPWPREDNIKPYAEPSVLQKSSVVTSVESPVCLATLPRLKSMTWAMQSRNSEPGSHITIITLKLQDYTKSHMGEVEVKFQLSRIHWKPC
ncbi:hypothetical protein HPP92_018373 [Vanilla planifolia]|uniref:Uncharacterized protein n=1 Tax=Vanilla planifolia TaxID=51239 RepID=A0A835UQK4_VANPL|nr:hypothetical protein HPP92_018373 [Vanilla planifolia]